MTNHEVYREWSAAYVLGALDGEERRLFEQHLEDCEPCRREVGAFAPIPGLLARVESADSQPVPDQIVERALARVRSERSSLVKSQRRWRWTAAFAAVVAAAVLVGSLVASRSGTDAVLFALEQGSTVSGEISVESRPWGTAIELELANLPPSDTYVAWAVDRDGEWQQVAVWGPTPALKAIVSGASSFATADLARIVVTTGDTAESIVKARPSDA